MEINYLDKFILVFGSVSRGDFNVNSDIDIFILNLDESTAEKKLLNFELPALPHSYVSYESELFNKFYEEGSLFLYHIFMQGVLVFGDEQKWSKLAGNFKLKSCFTDEIEKITMEISNYKNLDFLNGYYLSALVNIYPLIKNYCIFKLASNGIYEFNKKKCISLMIKNEALRNNILQLQQFYDYSTRGLELNLTISPNSSKARELLSEAYSFIKDHNDKH